MSAERLPKAAALMRSRAEAALAVDTRRWTTWRGEPDLAPVNPLTIPAAGFVTHGPEAGDHIAAADPTVMLAVADLFVAIADGIDTRGVTARLKPAEHRAIEAAAAYLRADQ